MNHLIARSLGELPDNEEDRETHMTCPHRPTRILIDNLCVLCWKERCEKAEANIKHLTTSIEEGTLPFWQHKHDEMAIELFKAKREYQDCKAALNTVCKAGRINHEGQEKAEAACAEMRSVLESWTCDTCKGTHRWTPECYACLSGESDRCTCVSEKEQDCPECWEVSLREDTMKREHALSSSCGQGYLPPDKARVLVEALESIGRGSGCYCECNEPVELCECAGRIAREALDQLKDTQ